MARKVLIWVVFVIIVANVTIVAVVFFGGQTPPRPVMPNPNGYDDFIRAGQIVISNDNQVTTTNQLGYHDKMSKERLSALVSTNAEALKLIRQGLARESLLPVDYSTNFSQKMMEQVASLKLLGILIRAEGRLAELEGRTNDAAGSYVDAIHFGQEFSRGGLLIHHLVGIACEAGAAKPLSALLPELDAQNCRQIARVLEDLNTREEATDTVLAVEKDWARKSNGLKGRLILFLTRKSLQPALNNGVAKIQANTAARRQLMVMFATRAYELENGKRPQSWADLTPGILKAVPQDSRTGTNMVFIP